MQAAAASRGACPCPGACRELRFSLPKLEQRAFALAFHLLHHAVPSMHGFLHPHDEQRLARQWARWNASADFEHVAADFLDLVREFLSSMSMSRPTMLSHKRPTL